jgi:hypothetical protein
MTSHGLRTVSSSHFGPANDQALFLITTEEEIPGSVVSWTCQGLPVRMEWAHCQTRPASDVW